MNNPNKIIQIERQVLWAIWNVITSTPFDLRDEKSERAMTQVRKLLNQ